MNTQPEALRIADALDGSFPEAVASGAADELRRLHAANQELLTALKTLVEHFEYYMGDNECRPLENARAAIEKVEAL